MQVGNQPQGKQTSDQIDEGTVEDAEARSLLSWRAALVVITIGLALLFGGGALVVRQLTGTNGQQLGTAPQPRATPASQVDSAPAALPAPAPTDVSTAGAVAAQATAVATTSTVAGRATVGAEAPPVATASVNAAVRTDQEIEDDLAASYLRYWDVTTDALWNLDTSKLSEVATGDELAQLGNDIERLRSDGRALKTEVQHSYSVVHIDGNEAQIFDRYRDFSIYVDANTKQPLPGELRPSNAENAPLNSILYHLRNEGGRWKVSDGERYANN